jgi:hypothetical protein
MWKSIGHPKKTCKKTRALLTCFPGKPRFFVVFEPVLGRKYLNSRYILGFLKTAENPRKKGATGSSFAPGHGHGRKTNDSATAGAGACARQTVDKRPAHDGHLTTRPAVFRRHGRPIALCAIPFDEHGRRRRTAARRTTTGEGNCEVLQAKRPHVAPIGRMRPRKRSRLELSAC